MVSVYRCNLLRWAEGEDGPDTDHIVLDPIPFAELLHCDAIGLGDTPEAFRTANPVGLWILRMSPPLILRVNLKSPPKRVPLTRAWVDRQGHALGAELVMRIRSR